MDIMLVGVRLSARDAIIPPDKLRDYLLSVAHPDGRGKSEYLGRLGYSQEACGRLETDLRGQILSLEAQEGRPSPYGQKYEILGPLTGPNGQTAWVRTIWIVLTSETTPRLVTLIPAEKP
jgi:filamentous hemagglutinin